MSACFRRRCNSCCWDTLGTCRAHVAVAAKRRTAPGGSIFFDFPYEPLRLVGRIKSWTHTVDGWNPKQPPGMVLKPYKYWEKLPTSTGEFTGFQPSTVGPFKAPPVRCRILSSRKVGPFFGGFFVGSQKCHTFFWRILAFFFLKKNKKHDQNSGKENIHNFRRKTEF